MPPIHVIRNALVAGSAERRPAVLWALASLALSKPKALATGEET